jgi:hypothetical protein
MTEPPAPQRIAVGWSTEARVDLRAIDRETALQILHCVDRYLASRTGDVRSSNLRSLVSVSAAATTASSSISKTRTQSRSPRYATAAKPTAEQTVLSKMLAAQMHTNKGAGPAFQLLHLVPRPCPCVLCRDRAGILTSFASCPRQRDQVPALSQRRDKGRATLESQIMGKRLGQPPFVRRQETVLCRGRLYQRDSGRKTQDRHFIHKLTQACPTPNMFLPKPLLPLPIVQAMRQVSRNPRHARPHSGSYGRLSQCPSHQP